MSLIRQHASRTWTQGDLFFEVDGGKRSRLLQIPYTMTHTVCGKGKKGSSPLTLPSITPILDLAHARNLRREFGESVSEREREKCLSTLRSRLQLGGGLTQPNPRKAGAGYLSIGVPCVQQPL